MSEAFFGDVPDRIPFEGPDSLNPLAYAVYQPDRLVLGRSMAEQLRIGVCLWHSFAWPGSDVFGVGTFDRPWLAAGLDPLEAARMKLGASFTGDTVIENVWSALKLTPPFRVPPLS